MPVWDLPTRLFHWALLAAVTTSYVSGKLVAMRVHMLSGYCVLALVLFRVVWGFVGSDTARFGHFLRSPVAALRHLAHFHRREPDTQVGHNEAGGWMVLGLLALLLTQVGTGLFANDTDAFINGPLAPHLSDEHGLTALHLHDLNVIVLRAAVILHVVAVLAYAVVKRHDLVRPMFSGKKRLPAATRAPRMVGNGLAAVVAAGCALAVWALVSFG